MKRDDFNGAAAARRAGYSKPRDYSPGPTEYDYRADDARNAAIILGLTLLVVLGGFAYVAGFFPG